MSKCRWSAVGALSGVGRRADPTVVWSDLARGFLRRLDEDQTRDLDIAEDLYDLAETDVSSPAEEDREEIKGLRDAIYLAYEHGGDIVQELERMRALLNKWVAKSGRQ